MGYQTEATLDLEMVSAVARGASLVLVSDANFYNALADAIENQRGSHFDEFRDLRALLWHGGGPQPRS